MMQFSSVQFQTISWPIQFNSDPHLVISLPDAAKITLILTNDKTELNYLVDKAELVQLESEANWESKANARINQIRRGDITVKYDTISQYIFLMKCKAFFLTQCTLHIHVNELRYWLIICLVISDDSFKLASKYDPSKVKVLVSYIHYPMFTVKILHSRSLT